MWGRKEVSSLQPAAGRLQCGAWCGVHLTYLVIYLELDGSHRGLPFRWKVQPLLDISSPESHGLNHSIY